MCGCYRKRPRLDIDDAKPEDVTVKTEPLIPGLDLVVNTDEDILDTGVASLQQFLG